MLNVSRLVFQGEESNPNSDDIVSVKKLERLDVLHFGNLKKWDPFLVSSGGSNHDLFLNLTKQKIKLQLRTKEL